MVGGRSGQAGYLAQHPVEGDTTWNIDSVPIRNLNMEAPTALVTLWLIPTWRSKAVRLTLVLVSVMSYVWLSRCITGYIISNPLLSKVVLASISSWVQWHYICISTMLRPSQVPAVGRCQEDTFYILSDTQWTCLDLNCDLTGGS